MPEEQTHAGDAAAHGPNKVVASHRFLAANTALPAMVGDLDTIERQRRMLKGAVRVELAGVRHAAAPDRADDPERSAPVDEEPVSFDVVVENVRVGHRFPTGTADSNEIWLAVEVRDADGKRLSANGELDAPGDELDDETHRFGVLQLDAAGKPALFRDAHRFAAVGWDTTIAPRDAKVVRYKWAAPKGAKRPFTVTSRVLYRKFSPAYLKLACTTDAASSPKPKVCPTLPIVEVARDVVTLGAPRSPSIESDRSEPSALPTYRRRDAYARGLLNALQEDVGDADSVLAEVLALAPDRADGFIDLARLRIRQGRIEDAMVALDRAAALDTTTPVVPYLRGVAKYQVYRLGEATLPLRAAVAGAPRSLGAYELLAEAMELAGDDRGALDVVVRGLAIDPESAQLRHLEALAFDRLGQPIDAAAAREGYLRYRRDDAAPALRATCKATVPGCAREAVPLHAHWLLPPLTETGPSEVGRSRVR